MKTIPLTQGKVALVDDEDFDYLNQWNWQAASMGKNLFYAKRGLRNGKKISTVFMHRLIMIPPNAMIIDHIDHNGLNNLRSNMRIVTHRENLQNRRGQSMFIGAYRKGNNRYEAQIRINGKSNHLGSFKTKELAHAAYMQACIELKNSQSCY